jgi:hypothetical protein
MTRRMTSCIKLQQNDAVTNNGHGWIMPVASGVRLARVERLRYHSSAITGDDR